MAKISFVVGNMKHVKRVRGENVKFFFSVKSGGT
jgi:hypothetical protein